jgi:hypothetical protein
MEPWPSLPIKQWQDTCSTLHMLTQIVGKIRLALSPHVNHYWNVALHPTPLGLTSQPTPCGSRMFEIHFDFAAHEIVIETEDGERIALPLRSVPVAELHREIMAALHLLDIDPKIRTRPSEIENPIPFERDTVHKTYDPQWAHRFAAVLAHAGHVLETYRSGFIGKCSPVHFFWGGFDLAVTRFSGRRAPEHKPMPNIPLSVVREAYSHEVMSVGFWPGAGDFDAAFYAYAYPEPKGFKDVKLDAGNYDEGLGEFLLPYDVARSSNDPDRTIRTFAEQAYAAAADLGKWDRANLER